MFLVRISTTGIQGTGCIMEKKNLGQVNNKKINNNLSVKVCRYVIM